MSASPVPAPQGGPAYGAAELATWSGGTWDPAPPTALCGVSNDSRTLGAGVVYVALSGERFDGHAYVAGARARRAAGAIVRADWPRAVDAAFPLLRVDKPDDALRRLAVGYRQALAPHCVGITGSAGKSTVKEFIADALATTHPTARTRGNWNNNIGLPLSLLAMHAGTKVGVFEVGTNHPGEIAPLAGMLQPHWGVITNIGAGHIENFLSVEAIADEKADLLRALPPDGVAFLNRDDTWFPLLKRAASGAVVTVSTREDADYRLLARGTGNTAVDILETASGAHIRLALPTGGAFQALNAMLAVAVARRMGVTPDAIASAFSGALAMPMRWQRLAFRGVHIVNDAYNANPLSMRAALEAFREEAVPGRKWLVLGGMLELGERSESEHEALGRDAAAGHWAGLLAVGKLGEWIARGAEAGGMAGRVWCCANPDEAARALDARAQAGDGVLLKASRGSRLEAVLEAWGAVPTNR